MDKITRDSIQSGYPTPENKVNPLTCIDRDEDKCYRRYDNQMHPCKPELCPRIRGGKTGTWS